MCSQDPKQVLSTRAPVTTVLNNQLCSATGLLTEVGRSGLARPLSCLCETYWSSDLLGRQNGLSLLHSLLTNV